MLASIILKMMVTVIFERFGVETHYKDPDPDGSEQVQDHNTSTVKLPESSLPPVPQIEHRCHNIPSFQSWF